MDTFSTNYTRMLKWTYANKHAWLDSTILQFNELYLQEIPATAEIDTNFYDWQDDILRKYLQLAVFLIKSNLGATLTDITLQNAYETISQNATEETLFFRLELTFVKHFSLLLCKNELQEYFFLIHSLASQVPAMQLKMYEYEQIFAKYRLTLNKSEPWHKLYNDIF
ncbi:MAG: hypothetical protein FWG64_14910 [Firmicutes bacterium]|nr:hypothetical protein [Bacillota bacterium]